MISKPRIALVHDDFCQQGGAEKLFAAIAQIYPDAPIYTALVNWEKLPATITKDRLKTSFMQKIPLARFFYKQLFFLYAPAFETFDFRDFDVVISSTTRFAKSIITHPKTLHICYINSVPRFLWQNNQDTQFYPKTFVFIVKPILSWLRKADLSAASRVDHYIANSQNVAGQINKIYKRQADVLHPFVDLDYFHPAKIHNWELKGQKYYLIVSRLVKWKKIDIAVIASKSAGFNLKIVGTGPDLPRLKKLAGKNVEFLGKIATNELKKLYQNARALIVTQQEDFGMAMVEAQACGIPIIAYNKGGQLEIVKKGKTGLLFEEQTAESLKDAIIRASEVKWNSEGCHQTAKRFDQEEFVTHLRQFVKGYADQR